MSPFAYQLRKIRTEKKLQQKDMAEIIGCEQSYLSALETDAKVPPQKENLQKLLFKLNLSALEESTLVEAADKSRRSIKLPLRAEAKVFEICHQLEDQLPTISTIQLQMIELALKFKTNEMGEPKM